MVDHPTRSVSIGGVKVEIDIDIADIIETLACIGISTEYSCQELEPGYAYIGFSTVDDLERFVWLLEQPSWQDSDNSILDEFFQRLMGRGESSWKYSLAGLAGGYQGN